MEGIAAGPDAPEHQAQSRRILQGLLVAMFFSGLIDGIVAGRNLPEPLWWTLLSSFLTSFLCFFWYRLDRDARMLRRSVWANVAIIMLTPVALPIYLALSRPKGARLRSFGRLGVFALKMLAAAFAGAVIAFLLT